MSSKKCGLVIFPKPNGITQKSQNRKQKYFHRPSPHSSGRALAHTPHPAPLRSAGLRGNRSIANAPRSNYCE